MEKTIVNPKTKYYEEDEQNLSGLGESEKFGIEDLRGDGSGRTRKL